MSIEQIHPELMTLLNSYTTPLTPIKLETFIVRDLGVTGSDYLDLISDIEKIFEVDLTEFLVGPEPKFVSTGLVGLISGDRRKSVFRDFNVREINDFLLKR